MSRPKRVLLIDDDDGIREVAQASLELVAGWDVVTADGGAPGLELALTEQPDLILLDVMMPGMDGPTTLAGLRAREETRATPVIFLTAKVQASERSRYAALDVVGLITKPFDPMELSHQVAEMVGWAADE